MKILLVNNFFYNRGGDCTYFFALKKLLENNGHKVIVFSMDHPQNFESEYAEYFVSYIDYADELKQKRFLSGAKVLLRGIYSLEARKKIENLINKEKPDIAHLNNIRHHVTTSIIHVLKKYNIPIVWTLHDYQLICPNNSFFARGSICERCKKRKYFWPLIVRCKKSSFMASAMAAVEHTAQMISKVYNYVDVFIAPSRFLRNKFIEYGFKTDKIVHLCYFNDVEPLEDMEGVDNYYAYAGRLSDEKGIKTLIDAVIRIKSGNNKLKIIGDGPLKNELVLYSGIRDRDKTIEFMGHKSRDEVIRLIKKSRFAVVPSEWYENLPFAAIEAFALGKPVVSSRMGGLPELVRDNETGLTFEAGDAEDLGLKIEYMLSNPRKAREMGGNARAFVERELNAAGHYRELMKIYKQAINKVKDVHGSL